MKYKSSIYNFSEKIDGKIVRFVRIANLFGFWFKNNGVFFGNYVIGKKGRVSEKELNEIFGVVKLQAKETIKQWRHE